MKIEELLKVALNNVPRYSLLNEIFAIRDNRFPDEENDYTIKVYGSISIDALNKYVRFIDRLVKYQSIDTINNLKELKKEHQQLKEIEKEHRRINGDLRVENKELKKQYCERTDCSGRLGNSKKVEQLIKENQELKNQLEKYENPEDMTLMMMWTTEKVKDENKELKDRIDKAVEYIEKHTENIDRGKYYEDYVETYYLLKILKGGKE